MKKHIVLLITLICLMISILAACGGNALAEVPKPDDASTSGSTGVDYTQGEKLHLIAADGSVIGNPIGLCIDELAKQLNTRTNGRITVDVYHNSELGSDREVFEQVVSGTIDFGGAGSHVVYGFVPACGVFDLPYLFTSYEHAAAVLTGPIGQDIISKFEGAGIKPLTWLTCGWRNVTSNKELNSPSDMAGVKIRIATNQVYIDMFEAVGAIATPLAFNELYTALQMHTVDAEENPYLVINSAKFYEVQNYIYETEHTFSASLLTISQKRWDSLSETDRQLISDIVSEMYMLSQKLTEEADVSAMKEMKSNSDIIIQQGIDKAPWIEAMRSIYPKYYAEYGEDFINSIANYEY
jgi:tripartite ATP-independent transporter DctP family solute receptor